MDIYIHKNAVGFSQHLVCREDTGKIEKIKDLPESAITFGTKEFAEIASLFGIECPEFPSAPQRKALSTALAGQNLERVPWALVMSTKTFMESLKSLKDYLLTHFSKLDLTYYQTHHKNTNEVFGYFKPAKIDPVAWKVFGEDKSATQIVQSFRPNAEGFTDPVVYSRETKTGRTKVVTGPRILTLPEDKRKLITSRFGKQGKVISVDYSSLEPRVALAIKDYITSPSLPPLLGYPPLPPRPTPTADLYQDIARQLELPEMPRSTLKKIILAPIYGASPSSIATQLGSIRDVNGLIQLVEDYFGLPSLRAFLQAERSKNNGEFIASYFGRPINVKDAEDYVLLNYFIQSTAVDVALYGFKKILEASKDNSLIVPIFALHDCLILDVHSSALEEVKLLLEQGTTGIPLFPGIAFPLKLEIF